MEGDVLVEFFGPLACGVLKSKSFKTVKVSVTFDERNLPFVLVSSRPSTHLFPLAKDTVVKDKFAAEGRVSLVFASSKAQVLVSRVPPQEVVRFVSEVKNVMRSEAPRAPLSFRAALQGNADAAHAQQGRKRPSDIANRLLDNDENCEPRSRVTFSPKQKTINLIHHTQDR